MSVVIYPARGYYRKAEADVQAWTGYVFCDGRAVWDIGSWDTVTACLRGFTISDCRHKKWADADFQVSATVVGHVESLNSAKPELDR